MSSHLQRPSGGIYTAEGNVAGSRAAELEKKRQRDQEAFESRKKHIHELHHHTNINGKFQQSVSSTQETDFKSKTVGLVTIEEFRKAVIEAETLNKEQHTETEEAKMARERKEKNDRRKRIKEKKKMISTLSFANGEEECELVLNEQKNKTVKDPTVDTSFLPDREREEQIKADRERLEREWKEQQEAIKKEKLEITYSYWDGSGHRRNVQCLKGDTVGEFLEKVRRDLCREFKELTSISADALIYVKEDLIIPQDLTFYDLIITKARGKSGPLFHFDVHDDVRLGPIDNRIEKDESHPGKVVERRWYERNKHIFPASRWEIYDPAKDYGGYTVADKERK